MIVPCAESMELRRPARGASKHSLIAPNARVLCRDITM